MFSSRLNSPPGRDERLQSGWIKEAPVCSHFRARTRHNRCRLDEDGEAAPSHWTVIITVAVNDGAASSGKIRVKERQEG